MKNLNFDNITRNLKSKTQEKDIQPETKRTVTVRMYPSDKDILDFVAFKQGLTRGEVLYDAMQLYIKKHKINLDEMQILTPSKK